jgi:addiction module HigA family antidote
LKEIRAWQHGKGVLQLVDVPEPIPRVRTHPSEVLCEEYLIPIGLSARALAKSLGVPADRLTEIVRGECDVTADTAIRLGRYFRIEPRTIFLSREPSVSIQRQQKAIANTSMLFLIADCEGQL